ncbi:MAG: FMN-binding protein [Treponema sp.]|nr:FMN-binding protein [Treponema sp.]
MKKLVIIGLALFLTAGMIFAQQQQRFKNGNFTATVDNSYDPKIHEPSGSMTVRATFRGNRITQIVVTKHTDTASFLKLASDSIIPAIIAEQNTEVDTVAGATYSSQALIDAVNDAMEQARR